MPYWLQSTLSATPALLGVFLGLGLPWALVILPRQDWRDRAMVVSLTLATGPALLTAWMFALGSVPELKLLRLDLIMAGMAAIALIGWALAWRRRTTALAPESEQPERTPFRPEEKLLITLIIVALIIRWVGVAYWPFTAYDALWVYGYEGRLYTLSGHIPPTIGYYPQFLPLQYTFLQLAGGRVDDHVARAILPLLHWGAILATYALGKRLFNRRTGLLAAAIWALYPHVGEWSRYGDLEIPLTFLFTLAAIFFVQAWTAGEENPQRRRYAIIGGLALGAGLWTKPTMGAFVWGVLLMLGLELLRTRASWRRWRPRFEVIFWTGLATLPLGAMWYLRNIALGHHAIDLPPAFWQSLAARSGAELGWPLLATLVATGYIFMKTRRQDAQSGDRMAVRVLVTGIALLLAGAMPSVVNSGRISIVENRMGLVEWALVVAGAGLLARGLWARGAMLLSARSNMTLTRIGWLMALALPYFITWFYSYSYHYRLSFAIVPLLIMPTAVILAAWSQQWSAHRRLQMALITALALPGIVSPLYDPNAGWDWLWSNRLPDDHARYTAGNPSLMAVVDGLQIYRDQHGGPLRVVAPGIKRLPFFFPTEDIRIDETPARLDELEGITYFIYGTPESGGDFDTIRPGESQVLNALALASANEDDTTAPLRRAWGYDDGIFKYTVYEMRLANRYRLPEINAPADNDVLFGSFARLLGHDIGGLDFWPGRKLILHLFWQVLESPTADYMVYIHLRAPDGTLLQTWDGPVSRSGDGNYYSTLVWEPGEIITDERQLIFDQPDAPTGSGYSMVVGMYDLANQERVLITVDGRPAGDGYVLDDRLMVVPPR